MHLPRPLIEMSALLALTGLGTAGTYLWHPQRPALYLTYETTNEGEISVDEARAAATDPGVIWIDARTRRSFLAGHVLGALLLSRQEPDYDDLMLAVTEAIQTAQTKLVIVYCDGKKCEASREAADMIRGFHPDADLVKVLHGGWPAWAQQ